MAFNESIQDPIVAESSQNSLEKYKFLIGSDGLVYVRVKAIGTMTFSGLSEAIKISTLSIGDTVTALPTTALSNRNSISIQNKSSTETLYVGPSNVEANSTVGGNGGWEIPPQEALNFDIKDVVTIYAIAPTGKTILVKILEMA